MVASSFINPFRPGAGHSPPYLAGREGETELFRRLLTQTSILENMVLTGLRGVGKTVLLESLKPIAQAAGWGWAGADLSESASVSETSVATRVLTDLAIITSQRVVATDRAREIGFTAEPREVPLRLSYDVLASVHESTPGLPADKLKAALELAWRALEGGARGIVFAYDEAQTMADHASRQQYPLSMLLDVFQSIQRKGIPFMLVMTGLPTLMPKLVDARTYTERMFRVVFLDRLTTDASRDAITKPIEEKNCPVQLRDETIERIIELSGGYPYFIQFICREVYDVVIRKVDANEPLVVPEEEITRKLDADFFSGRWSNLTDRQRDLLFAIAHLENCHDEFTVQEAVKASREHLETPFGSSHTNQILAALQKRGLIYKNRHGKYSFAVPLLGEFILRQEDDRAELV